MNETKRLLLKLQKANPKSANDIEALFHEAYLEGYEDAVNELAGEERTSSNFLT